VTTFSHPALHTPLDRDDADRLLSALTNWMVEQPARFEHEYDGRQSSGGDQRLAKGGFLGRNYVGSGEDVARLKPGKR
jgi:hypothetical protein